MHTEVGADPKARLLDGDAHSVDQGACDIQFLQIRVDGGTGHRGRFEKQAHLEQVDRFIETRQSFVRTRRGHGRPDAAG